MEPRTLAAMHPALNCGYDPLAGWTVTNGWQTDGAAVFHETVIDLSGYAIQDLTFFPQAVGLQDPGVYVFGPGQPATYAGLHVIDMITSVPCDINTLSLAMVTENAGPGMLGTVQEFETILFGMYRFFTPNTNITYLNYNQLERSQRFDSGQPNAADKLFCYRIVMPQSDGLDPTSELFIPAARQIIGGAMEEESELVYMQRLKRSYELANQV